METTLDERRRKTTNYWGITLAAIVVVGLALAVPMVIPARGDISAAKNTDFSNCRILRTPQDPIDMETVVVDKFPNLVKTVHKEKEVFRCQNTQGGFNVTVEMAIYTEITQNVASGQKLVDFHVVKCVKKVTDGTVIRCDGTLGTALPIGETFVQNCKERPVTHPTEMNVVTTTTTGGVTIVKTIEAQKEVFICTTNFGLKKVDVVIFTEVMEFFDSTLPKLSLHTARCAIVLNHPIEGSLFVESCTTKNIR